MARQLVWRRGVTSSTGGGYAAKGAKGLESVSPNYTLTRIRWSVALGGSTEFAPGPMRPFMVGVGIYGRPSGSGLLLYPYEHADAANWVSRANIPMRTLYWTFDTAGALLGGQRIGDSGPQDIDSKAQRRDVVNITDYVFSFEVDPQMAALNRQVNYTVAWSLGTLEPA